MYHSGHQLMHHYLIHKGMHPDDAHHVVINSGSGIADWFKNNKDIIIDIIKNIGNASLPYVKNIIKNAAKQNIENPLIRSGVDYLTDYGTSKLSDYLKKPKNKKKNTNQNKINGHGVVDFVKKHKKNIFDIGKASYDLFK